ncbi:hypothetical protein [uncultured Methylobacterium sp.]|uniref:hypothetical protein n=1 Tax=uncultured Methylobacterium sp. TaxID=157278 RepID=UPI0035CC1ABF
MLLDWIHYLTTPAPSDFRRVGFVRDSIWLLSRSRRCQSAWRSHLSRSRELVTEAAAALPERRTVVVLGSGLLDDVPFETLARSFTSVVLVDVVHPWPARAAARRHRNVRLVDFDLSGCVDWMLGRSRDIGPVLPDVCLGSDVDLVISANVLSQLPILPLDWFETHGRVLPDLGRRIVTAHLDGLAALTARVCLITDVTQIEADRAGKIVDSTDLLHGVSVGMPERDWDWDLAPFGEAARGSRLVHTVYGFGDWRRNRKRGPH